MIRTEPSKCINTGLFRPLLLIVALMLVFVSSFAQDQYESRDVTGSWANPSNWNNTGSPLPPPTDSNGEEFDIYGKITLEGNLVINTQIISWLPLQTIPGVLTVHDTLIINGNLTVGADCELEIGPTGVLIVNGDFTMDGFLFFGGSGSNQGDVVVGGDLNIDYASNFDTEDGNTYVEGNTNDPGGNINGDVQDEDDLADDNPDLYDDVYDDCDTKPEITLAESDASGCPGSIATLTYTGTANGPDEYRIDFSDAAEGENFSDVPYTTLSGGDISVDIPPTATSGTYQAVLKVRDIDDQCISDAYDITVTVAVPSITLTSTNSDVCPEVAHAVFEYSNPINNPDRYSIDFDGTAEAEGFIDVTDATLSGSSIEVSLPADPAPGTYDATLTVENTSLGCTGISEGITITVLNPPEPGITVDASSDYSDDECFTLGYDLVLNGGTYSTYSWNISPSNNDAGDPLSKGGDGTSQVTYGNFTNPSATSRSYTVTLIVTNAASCSGEDTMDFILRRRPETGNAYYVPNTFDDQ